MYSPGTGQKVKILQYMHFLADYPAILLYSTTNRIIINMGTPLVNFKLYI